MTRARLTILWPSLIIGGGFLIAHTWTDPHGFLAGWAIATVGVLGLMGDRPGDTQETL